MYEDLKKEISISQEEIMDLEKKLALLEKEQKEYEERFQYGNFEDSLSKELMNANERKRDIARIKELISEEKSKIYQKERILKIENLKQSLKKNNNAISEIDTRIETINKMMEDVKTQDFSSINETLKNISDLLSIALKERERILQENTYIMGSIRYLNFNSEVQEENLYDRLWKNALKENEKRDAAEIAKTDEERKKERLSAHAYAMNNARWNANPIKNEYNEALHQYENYLRNEIGKLLKLEAYEGIEEINPDDFNLDNQEKERFLELKEEIYKLNNKTTGYQKQLMPKFAEEPEKLSDSQKMQSQSMSQSQSISVPYVSIPKEETTEEIEKAEEYQDNETKQEESNEEIEKLSDSQTMQSNSTSVPIPKEETIEEIEKAEEYQDNETKQEELNEEGNTYFDEESNLEDKGISQGKKINKSEEIEKGIKRAEEKGKELIENIKAVANDDVMKKIIAATSKEKEKPEEKEAATDDVMKKIIAATNKEKPEEKETATDNVMEKILAATSKEEESAKEEENTAIIPVEAPIEEKEEPQEEEQEVKGVRKPKSKKKLRKSLYVKIAALIAGIVVLASIGKAYFSKKNHPKTPPIAIENLDSENNKDDIVIISNSGIPVAEETENTKEDLDYIDDDEKIPAEVIKIEEDDDEKIPAEVIQTVDGKTYEGTKPITPSVNQQALIDSGIITNSGENEQEVILGTGQGIKPEDLQYYDEDIHFEQSDIPGVSHIIETQDDGETVGMKNIPTDRIPSFIESVSKQTNQAQSDLYERYMPGTSVTAPQTSTNTEVKVTPQKEVLRQAIIDSGAMQTSANDEYSAIMNQGQGIKPENLEYWYDQGNTLEFFKNSATGSYGVIEPQKDGSKKILGWWNFDAVERYIESIAKNTDADFYDLFEKQTGENYLEELDSLNTKGASR